MLMTFFRLRILSLFALAAACLMVRQAPAQAFAHDTWVQLDQSASPEAFPLAAPQQSTPIYLAPSEEKTLGAAVHAFAEDIEKVTGNRPQILTALPTPAPERLIIIGTTHAPLLAELNARHALSLEGLADQWESALTTTLDAPLPGVRQALAVVGSDRRGAAFALFELSRQMGVSPWNWWADVPVARHTRINVVAHQALMPSPSVRYRGIFLNDEDWGLRPWAAKTMDPARNNIGPNTYTRIFELLLRLHANTLWPAMHPGTLAFNAVPENAQLADRWGIVMGTSHSEALLRNNVGEWNEQQDGPWNYQTNRAAIDAYWKARLITNGKYENFYTVGMRGVHDSGLEATGTVTDKARLVEQVMAAQRTMLAEQVPGELAKTPQVLWLYKESLELYRAGMRVPDDVTLGWTDDNYGYIRQLPTVEEQRRSGGSALYYHVSYWGFPHDHLWLCTTPPALMREELTKAYDHGVRKYWVLNVGDIKPAEADIDYFLQLAWNEPAMATVDQHTFFTRWFGEQFPTADASELASIMDEATRLNFIRKPEFMGFNGYNDAVKRTEFNPLAWGETWGQNGTRLAAWDHLLTREQAIAQTIPAASRAAFFELVAYPIEAAAEQNRKFLRIDRTEIDVRQHRDAAPDARAAHEAYQQIQSLTARYNALENGKWDGMMSSAPRNRHVFEMPFAATASDAGAPLPAGWAEDRTPHHATPAATGFIEEHGSVSINAAAFTRSFDGDAARWRVINDLGISDKSVTYGRPGLLANGPAWSVDPWLEYAFTTASNGAATLTLALLPTFPVDAQHRLRFSVSIDGGPAQRHDAAGLGEWKESSAPTWEKNVLRNAALLSLPININAAGRHTVRISEMDPGLVFEHLVVSFPGAPPAYPVPPETLHR